jgi:PAS domain S-box-containing protein
MEKDSINDPCCECDILEERNLFLEQNHPQPNASLEGKLDHAEMRYKRLAEAAFEGIVIHDYHHFIEANQSFLDMFGYTQAEIEEIDGDDLIAPEYLEITKKQKDSQSENPYEVECKRKDGSVFPAEFRAKQININDVPFRIVAVRDLTDQKELERKIAESEKRYRGLYNNSPMALYCTRISDGKLLECNQALVKLFGYDSKEEFQATSNAADRYVDINDRTVFLEKLKKDKRVEAFQTLNKRKDGELVWIEATAEIFPEQDFLEGAMQDITASKILTKVERTVLRQIIEGKTNSEIAYALGRSVRTIEDHRSHIMQKLQADNIVELIKKAKTLRPEA